MNAFPPIKAELIAGLDEQRSASIAYVKDIAPDLIVFTESGWTVKDLIIHLMALEADMITALHRAISGERFEVDLRAQATVNDLYELRRRERVDSSWESILDDWSRSRDQLRGLVIVFPADKMNLAFSNPFFQEYNLLQAVHACSAHERLHINDIRAATERQEL